MKIISLLLATTAIMSPALYGAEPITIHVDASKKIATVTPLLNGTNIEDLNNQTNGGLFSQLLHGEAFEENVDVDFLGLDRKDYSKIYVVLDERRVPHLMTQSQSYSKVGWNDLGEKYDFYTQDIYGAPKLKTPETLSGYTFYTRFLPFDSLAVDKQQVLLTKVNGNEQISKYWNAATTGDAKAEYTLVRDGNAYIGRQTQRMTHMGGSGEVAITNHGLYKSGLFLEKGKDYVGVLRVKSDSPQELYLTLRNASGKIIAEEKKQLKGNREYEKVEFSLIPSKSDQNGSFGISLRAPGSIDLGFAFLQPGEWGRVKGGWPIRQQFIDALKKQGITAIRYNGSMVDCGADKHLYRWKKMRGPIDERRITFRSGFNPYATHSFGFMEMLQAAEALGAEAIIGMSMNESAEDIRDFVEYVNGPITSEWGALRAADGHPESYHLKYIQVDNERMISPGYVECMKKFARAAWSVDPEMIITTSLNLGGRGYKRGGDRYQLASELAAWFVDQGKGDKLAWDPHYDGEIGSADRGDRYLEEMGIYLQEELAKDYPGFKLKLVPMEENGYRCDWNRGLAHAHNWNTNQRYGDCFTMLGTANTFQPHNLHYMWDQGRIHYTPDAMWFQPSAHIDEMMMRTWKPNVVYTESNDSTLDVTAKISDDRKAMTLYVVNLADSPRAASVRIDGFKPAKTAQVFTIGDCDLTEFNTYENQDNVVFKESVHKMTGKENEFTFPKYSFTVINLKR